MLVGYQAAVDWPACHFWRELKDRYPGAKVILSERDPATWYTSIHKTVYASLLRQPTPDSDLVRGAMVRELIPERTFDGLLGDRDHALEVYARHRKEVIDGLPADQLLRYEAAGGWPALCAFLGVAVPEQDFPIVNSTTEFRLMTNLNEPENKTR